MSQHQDSQSFFSTILILVVAAIMLTVIGDVWIHWPVLLVAFMVSSWAAQATGKKRKKKY